MTLHQVLGALAAPQASALHRRYFLSGAVWFLLATAMLLAACLQLGLHIGQPTPVLAVGRLAAAYKVVLLWGALSLPLAGALSALHVTDGSDEPSHRWSEAGLWLWNAGVGIGLVSVLVGFRSPGSWGGAPWWSMALVLAGAALWVTSLWMAISRYDKQPVSAWFALTACVVLLASLTIGLAASGPMSGVPRALADIMHGRLAMAGWLPLACFAVAAAVLPASYDRPLYSRRALWWGLWAWFALAIVLAVAPMHADLLPGWLSRPMTGIAVLQAVPAVLLAVGLLGTWVGQPERLPSSAASWLTTIAVAGVVVSSISSAGIAAWQTGEMQFTAVSSGPSLFPMAAALTLAAVGATYACLDERRRKWAVAPRYHVAIAVTAAVLSAAIVWPLGLAQAVIGPSGVLLRASFVAMLPAAVALFLSAIVWVANVGFRSSQNVATIVRARAAARPSPEGPTAVTVVGIAAVVLAGALFFSLFLPIVDPVMGRLSPRSGARDLMPGSLAAIGRTAYVADGCDGCHTQRVRPAPVDTGIGPTTEPGDYALGPALVGFRRSGPDLAWIGDRYPDRASMTSALAAHEASETVPMAWLVEAEGPTSTGLAVIEYLVGLSSHTGVRP